MSSPRNRRLRAIVQTICKSVRKMLTLNDVSQKEMPDAKICAAIRHALTIPIDDEIRISRPVVKFEMFPETIKQAEFKVTISIKTSSQDGYFQLGQVRNCKRKKYLEKQFSELFENIPKLKALKHIIIEIDMWPLRHVLLEQPVLERNYSEINYNGFKEKKKIAQYKSTDKQIILMADLMEGIIKSVKSSGVL